MDALDFLFSEWGTLKLWQKSLVAILVLGGVLFALNQASEFAHNMGVGHPQDNIVHVDMSGNVISDKLSNATHFVDNEILGGSGMNRTIANVPNPPDSLGLYMNGMLLRAGPDNDYIASGASIMILYPGITSDDQFIAFYRY